MMPMDQFMTFLDMGGYAVWVWSSYGISVCSLFAMVVLSLRTLKAREREFGQLKSERKGIRQ